MSGLRLSEAGPGVEQGWGELTETTVTLSKSVENGRTLSCTWTGSSSESASEKQVSSGPLKREVPKVQMRLELLRDSSVQHETRCLGPALHLGTLRTEA